MRLARLLRASMLGLALACGACGARSELNPGPRPADAAFDARIDSALDATTRDASSERDAPDDVPLPDAPSCRDDRDCDDRVPCTRDACDTRVGRCAFVPDDRDCDDGLFCTGVERCVPARGCVTTPRACGDAIECTVDTCDEETDQCVARPDNTRCPLSHRCDTSLGCVARALAHDSTTLYDVDLPQGTVHVIGATALTLLDVALHPDRTLYGAALGGGGVTIASVNDMTGLATAISPLDSQVNALDVGPDGALYGAASTSIVRVDRATGALTPVAAFPATYASSGDLAFVEGRLLATASGAAPGGDVLIEADPTLHTSRVRGPIGFGCVYGLAAFGPTLYGLTCEGAVLSIDPTNGRGTLLARTSVRFYGASAR